MSIEGWYARWAPDWRLTSKKSAANWDRRRRSDFLLDEAACPMSADVNVSPRTTPDDVNGLEMQLFASASTTVEPGARMDGPHAPGWSLLGYDVCDDSLLSGLMNCAYAAGEKSCLRERWKSALNSFHLFNHAADAQAFSTESDARVPEHGPFQVVAVCVRGRGTPHAQIRCA
jgi:hypothetical protein